MSYLDGEEHLCLGKRAPWRVRGRDLSFRDVLERIVAVARAFGGIEEGTGLRVVAHKVEARRRSIHLFDDAKRPA